jgi:hypothetical protein
MYATIVGDNSSKAMMGNARTHGDGHCRRAMGGDAANELEARLRQQSVDSVCHAWNSSDLSDQRLMAHESA